MKKKVKSEKLVKGWLAKSTLDWMIGRVFKTKKEALAYCKDPCTPARGVRHVEIREI